jgi:hypothetical protein
MTATRRNGTTVLDATKEASAVPAKQRAGARAAFERAGLAKPEEGAEAPKPSRRRATRSVGKEAAVPAAETKPQEVASEEPEPPKSKFTVLLDGDEATAFDSLALVLRKRLGRVVKKSDLVRALIALASDDQTLTAQLEAELRQRK